MVSKRISRLPSLVVKLGGADQPRDSARSGNRGARNRRAHRQSGLARVTVDRCEVGLPRREAQQEGCLLVIFGDELDLLEDRGNLGEGGNAPTGTPKTSGRDGLKGGGQADTQR